MKVSIEGKNLLLDVTAEIVAIPKLMTKHLHNLAERTVKGVKANIANGLATDGSILITNSINKIGRYSRMHGEERKARGLITSKVNLNFSGELIKDYKVTHKDNLTAVIGFESDNMADLAGKHENYYVNQIFDASDDLINRELNFFEDAINTELGL